MNPTCTSSPNLLWMLPVRVSNLSRYNSNSIFFFKFGLLPNSTPRSITIHSAKNLVYDSITLQNICLVWRIHISPFDRPCPEKKTISIIIIKYQNQLLNPFQIDQLGYREYLTSQFFSSQNNNQHILRFHILLAGLAIKFKLICFCCDVSRISISCKNFFS